MLRNLRWLSSTPRFLKSIQEVRTPLCVQSYVTFAPKFPYADPESDAPPAPLVPTGTLPPIPNEKEFTKTSYKSPGRTVQIYKRGNGKHAVFVIPGGLGIMRTEVLPIVAGLDTEKYTIYSWDQPGYGESTPSHRDTAEDNLYEDYKVLPPILKDLGHDEYSLLGHSLGAVTALMLTRYHEDIVRKVLLWGAFMEFDEEQIASYQKFVNIDEWGQDETSMKTRALLQSIFGEEYYRHHSAHWGEMLAKVAEKEGPKSFAQLLHAITCPVCFIHGEKDPMVLPRQRDLFKKYVKHAEVINIPEAKNAAQFETPFEFLTLVNEFLEKE